MKTSKSIFRSLLSLFLIVSMLSFPITALVSSVPTTTDYEGDYEKSPEPAISNNATVRPNNGQTANTSAIVTASTLADGVYAFRNIGNGSFWIDTQYNSTVPGYHLQQYIFNGSTPIDSFSRSCLFKITKVAGSGVGARYVVRSMLNNLMSFGFSGNDVMTKTIPANDADVAIEDTFYISYTASGYMIRPYGQSYIVAANDTDAYGASGAPDSYLINTAVGAAGSQGKWEIHQYTGSAQHGYAISGLSTGLTKGKTQTVSINTWSTVIGANTATFTVDSGYTSYLTVSSLSPTYRSRFQLTPSKIGFVQLHLYINNAAGTAVSSSAQPYIIGPDIPLGEPMYIRNPKTKQAVDIEAASTAENAILQVNAFSRTTYSQWMLERIDRGYYRIKSVYSGKYISLNSSDRTTLHQVSSNTAYSHWYFEESHHNNLKIICKAMSSKVIAIPSGTATNGTDLTYIPFVVDSDRSDAWDIFSAVYTLTNYYDNSFLEASPYVSLLTQTAAFITDVYSFYFNVDIEFNNSYYWSTLATNQCRSDTNCTDALCGSNCVDHHKNINTIQAELHNLSRSDNQFYLLWMDRPISTYCEIVSGQHTPCQDVHLAMTDFGTPLVRIFSITEAVCQLAPNPSGDEQPNDKYLAAMGLIAIHEIAHSFKFNDIYNTPGHSYDALVECVMDYYSPSSAKELYLNFIRSNSQSSNLFCDSCLSTIQTRTLDNPYLVGN